MDPTFVEAFRWTVEDAFASLSSWAEPHVSRRPGEGRWSAKEILGHLVDAASNNHQRFVRALLKDDLVFAGYDQDEWVRLQAYQEGDWVEILSLWRGFNLRLVDLAARIPADALNRARYLHNLHLIAWRAVPEDEPTTLEYLFRDYLAHLEHHLDEMERLLGS
ncbi:MAG TPA: DinB family protein [Longimicrobiales bacterium]|jgi:hypothetical protein